MVTESSSQTYNIRLSLTRPGIINAQIIVGSALTTGILLEESKLTSDKKKLELVEVYTSVRWHDEGVYEVHKVQKVICNHILKHVKFCKGKVVKNAVNNLECKAKRIVELGKSHKRANLSRSI